MYNTGIGECPLLPSSMPITIVEASATIVTMDFYQLWKTSKISWISTDCVDPSNPNRQDGNPTGSEPSNPTCNNCCPKMEEISHGVFSRRSCMCKNGHATVAMYVHDGQIGRRYRPLDYPVPAHCSPSADTGKKCRFVYNVPCANAQCGMCTPGIDTGPGIFIWVLCTRVFYFNPPNVQIKGCLGPAFTGPAPLGVIGVVWLPMGLHGFLPPGVKPHPHHRARHRVDPALRSAQFTHRAARMFAW